MGTAVLAVVGLLVGLAIGLVIARRRGDGDRPDETHDRTPAGGFERRWPDYTQILDRLSIGIVIVGADGKTAYRNRWAADLSGTHTGILLDATMEPLLRRALAGEDARQQLELYGPPRRTIAVATSILPGGGALATIEDESERRRIDAVRTDFVANISHELKTPVGALAVLAETILGEHDPDVVNRIAERMVEDSHRATRTIDDLLELASIELREPVAQDRVDLAGLVAESISRTRPIAEQRNIRIQVLDVPSGSAVTGDRRQLVSAMGNLVENAVKYSEPGGEVQVRVRVDGSTAELMVADHGIGIPARDHDRIFERFYRVDQARSRETGGTGLGLSIVRHVADNHGGEVLLSSQEGEGSTFVLRVPGATQANHPTESVQTER